MNSHHPFQQLPIYRFILNQLFFSYFRFWGVCLLMQPSWLNTFCFLMDFERSLNNIALYRNTAIAKALGMKLEIVEEYRKKYYMAPLPTKKKLLMVRIFYFLFTGEKSRVLKTLWGSGFLSCTAEWRPLTSSTIIAVRLAKDLSVTPF